MATKKNVKTASVKKDSVVIVGFAIRKDREVGENPFEELTAARLKTFKGIRDSRTHVGAAHDLYVRQLLHAGRIEGVKVQYKGYQKWLIDPASIDYYHSHKATRTGMRRFLLRTSAKNEDAVRDALTALEIEFTLEYNYKGKKSAD